MRIGSIAAAEWLLFAAAGEARGPAGRYAIERRPDDESELAFGPMAASTSS